MRGNRAASFLLHALMLACAAALLSCARQHPGPEVGDSVTNWLKACSDDSMCRGGAVCLNSLCTKACASQPAAACADMSRAAICDLALGACDLPCFGPSDCLALGEDFLCRNERCRAEDESVGMFEGDVSGDAGASKVSSSAIPLTIETSHSDGATPWTSADVSEQSSATFADDAKVVLSEDLTNASQPLASWVSDHFRVVWPLNDGFGVAEVYPDGRLDKRRLGVPKPQALTYKTNGDSVAQVGFESNPDGGPQSQCTLRVTELVSGRTNAQLRFPCSWQHEVAPIPGSNEWLVSWPYQQDTLQPVRYLAARYSPSTQSFVAGPWQFMTRDIDSAPFAGIVAAQGDALVWFPPNGLTSGLRRLEMAAPPNAPPSSFVPRLRTVALSPDFYVQEVIITRAGTLLFIWTRDGSRMLAIDRDGTLHELVDTAWFEDVRSAKFLPIPELGLVAVCTVTYDLRLLLLDEQGHLLAEPTSIQEVEPGRDAFESRLVKSCDLAWSGSELLIAWTRNMGESTGLPIAQSRPVVYDVDFQIVPLPDYAQR